MYPVKLFRPIQPAAMAPPPAPRLGPRPSPAAPPTLSLLPEPRIAPTCRTEATATANHPAALPTSPRAVR